ncbi:hypothetical protein DRW03_35370 [Corallococcus sp. H22C18031201]|nr:hypothetical protein DRW03_35370 [Corallococcus sp. H22C18031201]
MDNEIAWSPIHTLARRIFSQGEPLALTEETTALLRRTASEVGLSEADAQTALASEEGALSLLRDSSQRIHEGARRLTSALHRMYERQHAGDLDGARKEMQEVLTVEVVPHYRAIA